MEDNKMDKSFYDKMLVQSMKQFDVTEFEKTCDRASKERKAKELADLRDHFAGLAMQGLIADHVLEAVPRLAFEMADAMLKQRSLTNA